MYSHAIIGGDRDWKKPCPVCEREWDDHEMVGRSDFYTDDVCPIDLAEYIKELKERIAELEKSRVLKFRLPKDYTEMGPEE